MNEKDQFFELGKVIRVKGIKGGIDIFLDTDRPLAYKNLESVLLEINSELVPFFISGIRINGRIATITLDGIDSIDKALALVHAFVFLPVEKVPPLSANRYYLHDINGCNVVDVNLGALGTVNAIIEAGNQPLAELTVNGKEVLIPLQDVFIERLDKANKTLFISLPEGYLNIYLE